jgi:hypothetical protein
MASGGFLRTQKYARSFRGILDGERFYSISLGNSWNTNVHSPLLVSILSQYQVLPNITQIAVYTVNFYGEELRPTSKSEDQPL